MNEKKREIIEYYNSISQGYDELHVHEQAAKLEVIRKEFAPEKQDFLLDVGCGTCISFSFFDCFIYGAEPSSKMARKYKNINPKEKIVVCTAEEMDSFLEMDFFDFVICVSSAHHFYDAEKALENIILVSKKNVRIAFSLLKNTSNFDELRKLISSTFHIYKEADAGKDVVLFCLKKP